jgi:hypothetical protein
MSSLSPAAQLAAALLLTLPMVSCGPPPENERAQSGPIEGPFVVSDYFTPSGFMGDGATPGRLTVDINQRCKTPRPPGAQGDCYRFHYKPPPPGAPHKEDWAGAFWVFPANNWGTQPGRNVIGPVDLGVPNPDKPGSPNLRGYHYVRFSYAMEPLPNPTDINFWVGKLDGRTAKPPQKYYDVGCSVFPAMPPDVPETIVTCTDTAKTPPAPYFFSPGEMGGPATAEWTEMRIDLSRWSVESLISGFGYSSNVEMNCVEVVAGQDCQGLPQIIYIDDIVWE